MLFFTYLFSSCRETHQNFNQINYLTIITITNINGTSTTTVPIFNITIAIKK